MTFRELTKQILKDCGGIAVESERKLAETDSICFSYVPFLRA